MSEHFKTIYTSQADLYDQLVSREDFFGNVANVFLTTRYLKTAEIVELGAGTGRLTRWLATQAKRVVAFDLHVHMLHQLEMTIKNPVLYAVADNHAIPLASESADITVAGWTFGHAIGWYPEDWDKHIQTMLEEMRRITRPNGTMMIIETLGTGYARPTPPTPELAEYYQYIESIGFVRRWVRTDYQFESVDEAEKLTRFFFGDELANRVREEEMVVVPECTGVWYKHV